MMTIKFEASMSKYLAILAVTGLTACGGGSDDETVIAEPTPITNTAPKLSLDAGPATAGESYSITVTTADVDGDELTLSLTNQPDWLSLDLSSKTLIGTPLAEHVGSYTDISLMVSDGEKETLQLFSIDVIAADTAINQPPTISLTTTAAIAEQDFELTPTLSDPDSNELTLTLSNAPNWLSLDDSTNTLKGTPLTADIGNYSDISLTVSDGTTDVERLFNLEVVTAGTPVNLPPTIVLTSTTTTAGQELLLSPTLSDPEGDDLTLSLTNAPDWLSLDKNLLQLTGSPLAEHVGNYSDIQLTLSDGSNSVEHLFNVEVIAATSSVNKAPTISLNATRASVDSYFELTPTISDPEGDNLTLTLSNQPDWLSLDESNTKLIGTPVTADIGSYSDISLTVSDGTTSVEILFPLEVSAEYILPDNLIINVGDIDADGEDEIIELTKRSMRSKNGNKLLTWDSVNGYVEITPPQVRTYRGHVQGDKAMRVNANIEPGNSSMNANFSDGHHLNHRLTSFPVTINGPEGTADPGNGNQVVDFVEDRTAPTENGYIVPVHHMRRLDYAVTIQNDYYIGMGNSVEAAVARVEQRMNDTDFFYARDVGLGHEVNWMVVNLEENPAGWKSEWEDVHKPNGAVYEVRGQFKKPGGAGANGDLFKDAKHSAGTLAAYSKSQGHELGHTLGGGHWSSWGDAMSGSNSAIGSGTVERMIGNAHIATESQSPAISYASPIPPFAMEDVTTMEMNTSKDINVLENDFDGNGDSLSISYVDSVTEKGGTASIVDGKVRYTPLENWQGQDTFVYHVMDETGIANRTGYVKVAVHNNGLATHITFDETSGTTAHDIGPFQAHGELTDGIDFDGNGPGGSVNGLIGNALSRTVDGNSIGNDIKTSADFWGTGDPLDGDLSISLWVKFQSGTPTVAGPIIAKGGAVIRGRFGNPRGGWDIGHTEDGRFRFEGNANRDSQYIYGYANDFPKDINGAKLAVEDPTEEIDTPQFDLEAKTAIKADTWQHLVMVMDRTTNKLRAWVDNEELIHGDTGITTFGTEISKSVIDNSHHPLVIFDSVSQQNQSTDTPTTVDDVRIYHKALTPEEVSELFTNTSADIASGAPLPINGALDVAPNQTQTWLAGKSSGYQFDVYFGTDQEAVFNATTASAQYIGRQSTTTYQPTTTANNRYYWRIDTVTSGDTIKGDTWWFDVKEVVVEVLNDPAIINGSFENETLAKGVTSNDIADWFDAKNYTYTQNHELETHPATSYGHNWAELSRGRWIYQQIGNYHENIDLNISFLLGRALDKAGLATRVSLLVGGDPLLAEDKSEKHEVNPLTNIVGATLITSSELIPELATEGSIAEQAVTLSTGTGYKIGDPLWLQIDVADTGSGRVLIDNVQVTESNTD